MDVHQRRKCKRLKGAAAGLKTERSDAASRNPPLTRSTRCCHGERVIGSFELLKEAGRPYTRPRPPEFTPVRCFLHAFPSLPLPRQPLFLPEYYPPPLIASHSSNSCVCGYPRSIASYNRSPPCIESGLSV